MEEVVTGVIMYEQNAGKFKTNLHIKAIFISYKWEFSEIKIF